ncbi:MAG TPA: FAD-binding oxidoreductase [Roseomonas sp.]|jgi:D-amino-acid dehydrogenase
MTAPVVVIGGGFVGLGCALHLQRDGHAVVLLDPGDPMRVASYGNAGHLAVGEVVPLSGPHVLRSLPRWLTDPLGPLALRFAYLPRLTPWLLRFLRAGRMPEVERISAAMAALCDRIALDYPPLIDDAGAADLLRPGPHLRLYASRAAWQAEGWRWALRVKSGFRHELLEGDALHAAEPALAASVGFAVASLDRMTIGDPLRLLTAFRTLFLGRGGRAVTGTASGFIHQGALVGGVACADGHIEPASAVVVAAGAWSHRLARSLGDRVPLETERGYHVMLPDPGIMPRHSMSHVERGFALTPMEQGLRLAGTVEFAGLDAPPNWDRARKLMSIAATLIPGLKTEGHRFWIGHRPSLPDSLPVIDRAASVRNVVYAFGHGHMGLSWGATTGRLVAGILGDRPSNLDLSPFRLARFAS